MYGHLDILIAFAHRQSDKNVTCWDIPNPLIFDEFMADCFDRIITGEGDVMAGKNASETIRADGINIQVYTNDFENDFISLSDIARKREGEYPGFVIQNWMR